ncbi:protein phosphatase PTC7 homolog [Mya arenaria]|uniref:protein phosphatase PTC7 homolog n=1 Tax=Mya arenaria TaxID=6604 RepID=UPI0022E52985|nr:protein phosphatase PTC7 homolog [Mya arenaria]
MQSIIGYGRHFFRLFATSTEFKTKQQSCEPLKFVTGCSGFSKSLSPGGTIIGSKKLVFGDDAYFIARNAHTDVIGLADGVGGWRNYGIDPSLFSSSLMRACERLVKSGQFKPQHPANLIHDSYQEILAQKFPLIGGSTACVVALHKAENMIYTANLGDSGFLLIRDGEVVHRSEEQQHYFNTPFQLTVALPEQEGLVLSDRAESAHKSSYKVQEGDILLMGTDGLFDNMHEDMIVDYISKYKDHKDASKVTASTIAERAHDLSFDPDYMSPFALAAIDSGIELRGGKPDDITVIVARVSSDSVT